MKDIDPQPGPSEKVVLNSDKYAFSYRDTTSQAWVVEKGPYNIKVGRSNVDETVRMEHGL